MVAFQYISPQSFVCVSCFLPHKVRVEPMVMPVLWEQNVVNDSFIHSMCVIHSILHAVFFFLYLALATCVFFSGKEIVSWPWKKLVLPLCMKSKVWVFFQKTNSTAMI